MEDSMCYSLQLDCVAILACSAKPENVKRLNSMTCLDATEHHPSKAVALSLNPYRRFTRSRTAERT